MNRDKVKEIYGVELPSFMNYKGRVLDDDEAVILTKLVMSGKTGKPFQQNEGIMKLFLTKVVAKRVEGYKLPFCLTDTFIILCMGTWVRTPGDAMIMLAMAYERYTQTGRVMLDVTDFCEMFPYGVPDDADREKLWDSQKHANAPLGNMVDDPAVWGCEGVEPGQTGKIVDEMMVGFDS